MKFLSNLLEKFSEILKGIRALVSFFTIIPTGIHDIHLASRYYFLIPLVGFIEGIVIYSFSFLPLNEVLKKCLIFLTYYIITGFLHMDGFMDFLDAIFSKRKGLDALRIMKQQCRGSMSIVFTVIITITTFVLIFNLKIYEILIPIILLAKQSEFILAYISKPSGYSSLGRLFILQSKDINKLVLNNLIFFILIIIIIYIFKLNEYLLLLLLSVTILISYFVNRLANNILGFVNGDVLGFCFESSRFCLLLISFAFT